MKLVRWVSDFGCHFYVSYGSVEPYRTYLEVSSVFFGPFLVEIYRF